MIRTGKPPGRKSSTTRKGRSMDRKFQYLSMAVGVLLLIYGIKKLIESDWVPFVLGFLIIGFTLSIMKKNKQKKD